MFFSMYSLPVIFGFSLCIAVGSAKADIWKYVDENGVIQFSNQPVGKNGQLVIASGQSADAQAVEAVIPNDKQAIRSVALMNSSPTFHAVHGKMVDASVAYGVDSNLIKAVVVTESGFNLQAVSPKGAVGLMQIMPATARQYGVMAEPGSTVARKLTNPELNIHTGTKYLSYLLRLYGGQVDLALAAYNAGEGAVFKAGNQIPDYKETQDYVRKVLAVYKVLQTRPV